MRNQTLPKTVSLVLAATMMMLTLGAIDELAANGQAAVQMAANAAPAAKAGTPANRPSAAPRS